VALVGPDGRAAELRRLLEAGWLPLPADSSHE
jgi:hypothetical protein